MLSQDTPRGSLEANNDAPIQKNETNKDGGGKGQWSAWKAAELSKKYEEKGA